MVKLTKKVKEVKEPKKEKPVIKKAPAKKKEKLFLGYHPVSGEKVYKEI